MTLRPTGIPSPSAGRRLPCSRPCSWQGSGPCPAGERPTSGSRTGRPEAGARCPPGSEGTTHEPRHARPPRLPARWRDPSRRPAPQAAASRPASPGCERLEAAQHRGGRSRSRRWRPLRTPRGAPLAAILLSPGTRSAAEAFFCGQARSRKGRTGSRRPAALRWEQSETGGCWRRGGGAPPGTTRRAGHTTSCDLALPSPEEAQQSVQPARRVPSLHLQASTALSLGTDRTTCPRGRPQRLPPAPNPVPHRAGHRRTAVCAQVLGVSFLGKGLVLAGAPGVRDLLQLPGPKTPSKLRKSPVQTKNYKGGRGGAAPGLLERNR